MSIPTKGESYSRLMEHIRLAQEEAAMLAHLANANDDRKLSKAWLGVSELFRKMGHQITTLATRGMQ